MKAGSVAAAGGWLRRREAWVFGMLVLVVGAIGVRWLWLYRHGQPYDIDEHGYLGIALSTYRGLFHGGLHGWWDAVMSPSFQAPLMTAATTPAFLIGGPNPIVGLLVPLALGLVAVGATFLLGRQVGGARVAWLAGSLALGAPMLLNYSRSYNFAIAATATVTLALLAFARSDNLRSRRWSAVLGLFLGLTALARTMALAFLPALLVAVVVAVVAGPRAGRGRRAANATLAVGVGVAVAFPWYQANGSRVYDYLTSFGYGSRAGEYGAAQPFLSFDAWRVTAQHVEHSVFLPLLLLLAIGAVTVLAVTARQIRRRGLGPAAVAVLRSPLMPSALLVIEGLAALTSSRNKGSGFIAPLIPAMAVCAAWAVARFPLRPRRLLTGFATAAVVVNVLVAADLGSRLAHPWRVEVPVLGWVSITDGRGTLQEYEGAFEPGGTVAQPLSRRQGQAWVAANADVAGRLRGYGGPHVLTAFGFRHQLLNVNSVQIEEVSADLPQLPLTQVAPTATTDTVEGYARWLGSGDAAGACNLLISPGAAHEFPPLVTTATIEEAAIREGFIRTDQWTLPDNRTVTLWRRPAHCPSPPSA